MCFLILQCFQVYTPSRLDIKHTAKVALSTCRRVLHQSSPCVGARLAPSQWLLPRRMRVTVLTHRWLWVLTPWYPGERQHSCGLWMLILLFDGKPWLGRLIHRQALASVLKGFKSPATRGKHWQQQRSPSSSHQELAGPHMLKKRRRCCGTWARWFSRQAYRNPCPDQVCSCYRLGGDSNINQCLKFSRHMSMAQTHSTNKPTQHWSRTLK